MNMTGNTILITGGASGIGLALAGEFHKRGNQVIIAGRRKDALDAATSANPGMHSEVVDLADPADNHTFAAKIAEHYPALNVLINNAGIMKLENLNDSSGEPGIPEAIVATNLLAPIRLSTSLLPLLKKQKQSTVMMVSSGLAFVPLAMTPTYCATKAAIHSYSQSLRFQLQGTAVEVLELVPPYVATELMGPNQAKDDRAMPLDEFIAEVIHILETQPKATEICVKRVELLRFAAEKGHAAYDQFVQEFNQAMSASL